MGEDTDMSALDAFSLSERDWEDVEDRYERAAEGAAGAEDQAAAILVSLLAGLTDCEQKALALGVVVGRMSR
jgi:hypothetical protein